MSKRRTALTVLVGVLLGFFLGVAALQLGRSSTRHQVAARVLPADAGAAAATARSTISAMYGTKQAQVHRAAVSIPPLVAFIQPLSVKTHGCPCPAVFQLQRALAKAGLRRGPPTGFYGKATAHEVARFQHRVRIKPATGRYGARTHFKLSKFYDAKGRGRLTQVAKDRSLAIKTGHVLHAINVSIRNSSRMRYSQGASRGFLPSLPAVPLGTDCSGWATWIYKVSGLPDPSGFGYRVIGYTGTLAQHGVRISANAKLQIGDLVFYGGGWPYGHVAVVKDGFLRTVAGHGGPGIRISAFNYRPVSAIRRYY